MAEPPSRADDAARTGGEEPGTDAATVSADARSASSSSDQQPAADSATAEDDRSVVVPTAVYKRVTVFSTLIAVVAVVGGFLVLDVATDRATAELGEIDPFIALAGVVLIVFGGATYAFSTRFQADGMGNAKDETDESSNNG